MAAAAFAAASTFPVFSLPASHYVSSSMLASGKWAKVKVGQTGMQFLSNAQLKNLGFADPTKVNVYGYGGRMISEILDERQVDDLPLLPCVRTEKGLVFFGVDYVGWEPNDDKYVKRTYRHIPHAYEDVSYYFLSDREAAPREMTMSHTVYSGTAVVKTFTERVLHEKDLVCAAYSGREMLGEDFRTATARTFPLRLPDNAGSPARIRVRYGAKTSGQPAVFTARVNGKTLGQACSVEEDGKDVYCRFNAADYTLEDAGDGFDMEIRFSLGSTGVLSSANLDYIAVEYERHLRLRDGSLYFYMVPGNDGIVEVSGCSTSTVLWDVTDAENPKKVDFELQGDVVRFGYAGNEYREFVAFDPERVSLAPVSAGSVANQDIHSMPVPDMLIITPKEYQAQAERVADLHRRVDGMTVHVFTPDLLYNEFSCGTKDISAFRKAMKMWYDRGEEDGHKIRYCLIMSRPTYDNKLLSESIRSGYPRIPIWQSHTSGSTIGHSNSFSTDDIIGMLEDYAGKRDLRYWNVNVAVGRMPVKSVAEATSAVDKLIKYVETPDFGLWRNSIMLVADDDEKAHFSDAEYMYNMFTQGYSGASYAYDKLYFDAYPLVPSGQGLYYPAVREKLASKMAEGVMFVSYVGHGSPTNLSGEGFMRWEDINSFSNKRLPFFYTATCEFAPWDEDDVTGGEIVWLHPNSGFIGLISTCRTVLIESDGGFSREMSNGMLSRDADGNRKRVGDIYLLGKNGMIAGGTTSGSIFNRLHFIIIGDPALQLPIPQADVVVEKINGESIAEDMADAPVLPARGKATVEGYIAKTDGTVDEGFNGTLELILFDAETVVTTKGNHGKDPYNFNDRSSRLFRCNTTVTEGRWSAEMFVPLEIENNYSPAMITLYAYSDAGVEANGHTDKLYVYGYDENAPEDNQGPEIKRFTLNNDSFRDGSSVSSSPLVLAEVSDESGINMSSSGMGHSMLLMLDGKKSLSDVVDYYMPYPGDPSGGTISYLLSGIEPGEHTLDLMVWDNAGNSSKASLRFAVGAHESTVIYGLTTDKNPASDNVTFMLTAEQPEPGTECIIDVLDLNGRRLWSDSSVINSAAESNVQIRWDLRDGAGHRVPRGIYLYRATVKNSKGVVDMATRKLAVTAQ